MIRLNFPPYGFRFKKSGENVLIFDSIRRRFIVLTPEEWVRQHVVEFLSIDKKYPRSLINVEKKLMLNGTVKRYDVVVFRPDGSIAILVECKAPGVRISQETFDQIARYNMALYAGMMMVTNGFDHFYCTMDTENRRYNFLPDLPLFESSGVSR